MYPRNAASPPRIVVGSIYQISDGAKQTTGASATVTPEGGAETAAAGTLACLATSGEWVYTPTQAETNYTAFVVSVYKASCTSVSVTVVTTAESTAGKVSLGSAQTANLTGNITGNLSGSVGSVTGAVGSVTGAVGSVTGAVTVDTNNDKTGYALTSPYDPAKTAAQAATALSNATWTDARAGYIDKLNVTGTLAHSDAAATYKADVSALALEATLTAIKGATFDTATDSLEAIRNRGDAVWITATGFSTLDAAGVRSAIGLASANLDTQLGDIPTVAEFNTRTLLAASYATAANQTTMLGYVDCLPATWVIVPTAAEIKTALEADGSKLDHLWEMTEDDGGVRRLTTNALEQAPSGGSAPSVIEIWAGLDATQLAKFLTVDTGQSSAAAGSVGKIAQGSATAQVSIE